MTEMVACQCPAPLVGSMTNRTAEQYPDQYCMNCGRWLESTLTAARARSVAKAKVIFKSLEG